MGEPLTTGAVFALCIALVEIIKKLIEKKFSARENESETKTASALVSLAASQERICTTLDRMEARLEKTSDAVAETKFKVFNGHHNNDR